MGIKEKMKRYFKYRYFRFLVKLNSKKKFNTLELDKIQKSAYEIVVELINDKNSKLSYDPIEGSRAIENKDIVILFGRNKLTIFNDGHPNDVPFDDKSMSEICDKFNEKLSKRFKSLTNRLMSTVKNNLDDIKNHIEH
jgi:transposase